PATQAPPYSVTVGKSGSANYASTLAQPYDPAARLGWTPRTINLTTGASSNLNSLVMDPIFLNPTTYQWNLNFQYEFLPKWVVEIGYVGSRSIHQTSTVTFESQINGAKLASVAQPINGVTTNTVGNASIRVPYLGFSPGGLGTDRTRGDDKFNSIQATVRKQFSHGLQMQAAYSYSRSFDTATYNNFNDPLVSVYGPNSNYRPHRLTINYSYELPFGQRQGFIGKVANGWSIAGVTVIQNGSPLTIIDTRGGTIYGFGGSSPVQSTAQFAAGKTKADVATTGDIHTRLGGVSGGVGYFDPNAFGVTPILGTFPDTGRGYGNSGLGIVLGPGQVNFDGTLQKITRVGGIREDANLVFRAEFFNMFNHAQFSNPTGAQTDISKSNFGQITSTSVNPRLIQFALKYVF
ncbi:MAG TPA: hypothetical protein VG892_06585, partial [Terriglobales bacterium]|nr:hypothetical protein [Terriglobales bacterium]